MIELPLPEDIASKLETVPAADRAALGAKLAQTLNEPPGLVEDAITGTTRRLANLVGQVGSMVTTFGVGGGIGYGAVQTIDKVFAPGVAQALKDTFIHYGSGAGPIDPNMALALGGVVVGGALTSIVAANSGFFDQVGDAFANMGERAVRTIVAPFRTADRIGKMNTMITNAVATPLPMIA